MAASSSPSPSLGPLLALVETDMAAVNRLIVERMHSPVALIPQLAAHLVAAGGKRLRPLLTLATAALGGYRGTRHQGLAACVEFIHTATLLHDDVVDESLLRRGQDSANALFGNKASVLVGDFLFSRAFELMVADGDLRVLAILSRASAVIAEGEVLQLQIQNDLATTEAAYLEVITAKTAVLFEAAAQVGAIVAECSDAEVAAVARYGMALGTAFQLVDDALDYSAEQETLGKTVGDDFREGKVTLPIILAYARGDETERAFWRRTIEDLEQTDADLATAQDLLRRHRALADTIAAADRMRGEASAALAPFTDGPVKAALIEAVAFAVARGY